MAPELSPALTAPATSPSRFSNWSLLEGLSRFGSPDSTLSIRSFFQGGDVHRRMDRIRDAIVWIRENWETDYLLFMTELQQSFLGSAPNFSKDSSITSLRKQWADRRERDPVRQADGSEEDYTFLKLYTSEEGYKQIFSVLNNAFRADDLSDEETRLRAAVFLVELLTIELFNYTFARPNCTSGFTGIIYRGMCLSSEHLENFLDMMGKPIKERYWSIPLAFMSCTMSRGLALSFAEKTASEDPTCHQVLFRIHVANLEQNLLNEYKKRFPSGVVTTVCAVNISALSEYPEEQEVILRGPFFQLINARMEKTAQGRELHILDVLVFNTNRDHPSTMEMEEEERDQARVLFACLIEIARSKECMRLANECGIPDDVAAYQALHDEAQKRLIRLRLEHQRALENK
ncbi:hypothetical protein AMATHDRAFT_50643 [Amanita thiersii Skay4041]|uniref:Uncharacterized protein n=1 Tax=Amanita thiersii Skay4041 TaxID=703135 RepID=A0A2A9NFD7_9AGAR|nr:hypothetical protein AMATHDRAFT_50643 [Amanita thiersii Skay4041]